MPRDHEQRDERQGEADADQNTGICEGSSASRVVEP
jgi:hypothetical protein